MKRITQFLLLLLLFPWPARSWWSFEKENIPWSSHRRITQSALSLIQDTNEYPDLNKFSSVILETTTGDANDADAHGKILVGDPDYPLANEAGRFNGGPFALWQKRAVDRYKEQHFAETKNGTYYYFGLMTHLLQDQAVPAHSANIYHGQIIGDEGCYSLLWNTTVPCDPDDFELYSAGSGPGFIARGKEYGKRVEDYYYRDQALASSIVHQTQSKLTGWKYPDTGENTTWRGNQYWIKNSATYSGGGFMGSLANTSEAGGWGHYGGTSGTDMYLYLTWSSPTGKTDSSKIAEDQLKEAAEFTAGMLMGISRGLPPVIKMPMLNSISGEIATINPGQTNTISFLLQDNRPGIVTYQLVVGKPEETEGEDVIINLAGQTENFNGTPDLTFHEDPSQTLLPFHTVVTKEWNGLLASGSTIQAGIHTLYITGTDEDQNLFEYVIGSFTVTGAPFVTVATPLSMLYSGFSGVSSLVPGAVNLAGVIDYVHLTAGANGSPVAQLKLKRPDGTETICANPQENIPCKVEHLTDGRHEVTVLDAAGNRTFAAFNMGTIEAVAAPGESTATYNGGSDKFSAELKFHMRDWFPLEKASLFDGSGALLRTDALTTPTADITYSLPDLFSTEGFTRDFSLNPASGFYTIKLSNKEGHGQDSTFALAGTSRLFTTRDDIDLAAAAGFIPGVMGRTKTEWLGAGVNVRWDVPVTGPLVNSQEVGLYKASVLTGDKADFSDAVEQTLGTRSYYYSVWDYRNLPPQNCGSNMTAEDIALCQDGTYTPEQCAGYVLCHSDAIMQPTALKRYNRTVSTVYPAVFAGVLTYFCSSPVDGNCEAGYHPELTAPMMGSGLEAWGVSYNGGGYRLDGGLRAAMPAGNNVTVKLADWLSLTFETVTKDWSVGASLRSIPSLPGMQPLRTLTISGAEGAYTGNVSVSLKYDAAGITEGQLNFMEALKINNAAARDFDRRPILVDKPNHTAVFNTPDLGDFMLEVPSYPAPYAYASAELTGTTPQLGLLAGEPGATMTLVQAGSPTEQNYFEILNSHGLVPAGDAYVLGPTGKEFPIAAAIKMLYDKAVIPVKKLREPTLAIYQISEDGTYFSKLGNSVLNMNKGEITAEVTEFHSIFVIAGSTEPAPPAPLLPDVSAPVSNLAFGIPAYETGGMVLISSASPVFVDAYDPETPGKITSGLAVSYYLIDVSPESCVFTFPFTGQAGTCLNPVYSGPFTLSVGTHTVWYRSEDNTGHSETGGSKILYVDGDAPQVTVSAAGQPVVPGGTAYITEADSITLTSLDPASSGPVSGVGMTVFDVSTFTCTGFANYPRSPGVCRKILYTEPFALPVGTHTVYYSAMDNVGNVAAVKNFFVTVAAKKYENPAQWPYYEFLRKFGAWDGSRNLGSVSINFDKDANMLTLSGSEVQKYTADGEYLGAFGAGQLYRPESMATCSSGDTWIIDYDYTRSLFKLKQFGFNGALLKDIKLSGRSDLNYVIPVYVACGQNNLLYIFGFEGAAWIGGIFKFDASGIFLNRLPVSFPSGNTGLTADAQGNLYTRNFNLSKAYKYSPEGQLLFEWATNPGASGTLAADDFGNIYLNNSQKHMLEVYASTGGTIASFGSLPAGYTREPLTPTGILAIHPVTGRVFVADSGKIKVYGLDHTPPSAPVILSPINIGTVYTQSPLILGRAESGAVLQIYENSNLIGAINTDEGSIINAKSPLLTYGSHLLNFKASDLAGNLSAFSPAIHFSVNSANQVAFSTSIPGPVYPQVPWTIKDTSATVAGDFNRDGKVDVVGFSRGGWYSFYAGNNDGTFRNVYNSIIPGTNGDHSDGDDAVAADFNKDGKLDVAASIHNPAYPLDDELLVLLYGNGDGTFQSPVIIDHLLPYAGISKGDFNKDGYTDIASVSGNAIKVYFGDPAYLFISISTPIPAELPAGRGGGIVMADIDSDGKTDILFRNAVLFGNGSAGFDSRVILSYDYAYTSFANVGKTLVSDLNQDGRKDITLIGPEVVSVFVNIGNRIFKKVQQIPSGGTLFYSGGVADFNGDGVADIAVSPYNLQNVFVMAGYGDGTFAAPMALPTYGYAQYGNTCGTMVLEDLNGDGETDILQSSSQLGLAGGEDTSTFDPLETYRAERDAIIGGLEAARGARRRVALDGGDEVLVTVPAGVRAGTRLRLRGRGRARPDGSRGDAYLAVELRD